MTILVQRDFHVADADVETFEQKSREGVWPMFMCFGALMVGFVRWSFGSPAGVLATHTCYEDFDHWQATRMGRGSYFRDEAMLAETSEFREKAAGRNRLIASSQARVIELLHGRDATPRRAGEALGAEPDTFGRGSVIVESAVRLQPGAGPELLDNLRRRVWPWLGERGARVIAAGLDLANGELVSFTAYRSLEEWRRTASAPNRPGADRTLLAALQQVQAMSVPTGGRCGVVASDWGNRV